MLSPQVLPLWSDLRHLLSVLNVRRAYCPGLRIPSREKARLCRLSWPRSSVLLDLSYCLSAHSTPVVLTSCGPLTTFGPLLLPGLLSPGSCVAHVLTSCQACSCMCPSQVARPDHPFNSCGLSIPFTACRSVPSSPSALNISSESAT